MKTLRIDGKDYQVEDQIADSCLQTSKRADAAEKQVSEVLAALGVDTHEKAMATAAGLKEKAGQADKALEQLAKVQAEQLEAKRTALLTEASKDGRLTPANMAKLTAADAPAFSKDPAALAVYLDMLPKPGPAPKEPAAADAGLELSADEKRYAQQLKVDPKQVLEFKAQQKK